VIGVDANVLIRYLTRDDEGQYRVAEAFFHERSPNSPAFVSAIVLAETVWVLRSSYDIPFKDIVDSVSLLLESDDFVVEGGEAFASLKDSNGNASQLIDFMIAQLGLRAGCTFTVTLDKRSARSVPSMELLQ
jgi:Predicted nucleic-acid-binding protein, contains PIN domain